MRKKATKKLTIRQETIATLALVRGGVPTTGWPDPPPTGPTGGPTACTCPPRPTATCDGCTLMTF